MEDYNLNFKNYSNLENIDLSTKLIGVVIQEVIEKEYLNKEESKLKEKITKKINDYLKLPIIDCKLTKDDNIIWGHIEIRNRVPIKFKLEIKK